VTTEEELRHLRRCLELATEALEAGDEPFGSVLAAADGTMLAEDRNRVVSGGDRTRHPEFELARWAAANLTSAERAAATVFTSGEHCPMCAAAHGWVGLGRIVYVSSSEQLAAWSPSWASRPRRCGPCPSRRSSPTSRSRARCPTSPKRSTTSSAASTAQPDRRGRCSSSPPALAVPAWRHRPHTGRPA
jgi:tRNA(Arg) A34 adenosine deaminase TadA